MSIGMAKKAPLGGSSWQSVRGDPTTAVLYPKDSHLTCSSADTGAIPLKRRESEETYQHALSRKARNEAFLNSLLFVFAQYNSDFYFCCRPARALGSISPLNLYHSHLSFICCFLPTSLILLFSVKFLLSFVLLSSKFDYINRPPSPFSSL